MKSNRHARIKKSKIPDNNQYIYFSKNLITEEKVALAHLRPHTQKVTMHRSSHGIEQTLFYANMGLIDSSEVLRCFSFLVYSHARDLQKPPMDKLLNEMLKFGMMNELKAESRLSLPVSSHSRPKVTAALIFLAKLWPDYTSKVITWLQESGNESALESLQNENILNNLHRYQAKLAIESLHTPKSSRASPPHAP
jgi:hypothetical protein